MDWIRMMMDTYPYYIILILAAFVYELGFARKLPILKKIFIYILLAVGCVPLTILKALGLPMIEAMLVAAGLLLFVRFRRPTDTRENEGMR
ncbi:YlaH-like family protein [Ammoniphilus sp. YIM 78166]|uniref:YlaH-like family protein n=1 Tax=Ammoniphilus sp. YIM 78166 TaxID=1644106 RepID=UPI00106F76E2|nr:YlaH-like family protein [Ammoniphilus sp. YIM 78166]